MHRNPISIRSRGKATTSWLGGMPLDSNDHYDIVAEQDGRQIGHLDLYVDPAEQTASIELLEVPREVRNSFYVIVPLMRTAFAHAKQLGCGSINTSACWQGVYRFAIRFRRPDVIKPNDTLMRLLGSRADDLVTYVAARLHMPIDQIPPLHQMPNYSDPETGRLAPFYETGIKTGDFFNDGLSVYRRTSVSATDDAKNRIKKIANVAVEYDYKRGDYRLISKPEPTPESMTRFLPKKSPLDAARVNLDKVPMLRLWWYL